MTVALTREWPELPLSADQLVAHTSVPLGRAALSRGTKALLWALRVFTLALAALVVGVFVLDLL